jgi:hypothetical protein
MKEYKFTFEFNDHKDAFPEWDQWNMGDVELDVTYNIIGGVDNKSIWTVHVSSVTMLGDNSTDRIELRHILAALGGLKDIKRACEDDLAKLRLAKILAASLQPTTDQILKLK